MHLKGLFKKENQPVRHQNQAEAPNVPDGLYTKCESCHEMILTEDFTQNAYVCPKCGHYMNIGAYERMHRHLKNGTKNLPAAIPVILKDMKKNLGIYRETPV